MRNQLRSFFFFLLLFPCFLFAAEIQIVDLKVEYTETPLGIDVSRPRFSWQMTAPTAQRGSRQTAYQLIVTKESGDAVWNSGEVKSDVSLNIEYNGKPLAATTRYNWIVNVWDQRNEKHTTHSWFETGLMNANPNLSAWSGAKWIGGGDEDMVLFSHSLPVFAINFSFQLDEKSNTTRAGFIYGANDMRLMDKNKNLFHLESKKDSSYIMIELDTAPLHSKQNAKLNIYRVGYHTSDKKEVPFKSFTIPSSIINDQNKYGKHRVTISSNLGFTQVFVDGTERGNLIADINLNPLGGGGDHIAFPVVADIGYTVPKEQSASFSNVEIKNFRSPSNVLAKENTNTINGGESGTLTTYNPSRNAMPLLRTTFSSSRSKVSKARLYITARGIYEVYLNGKRIGEDYFNPGSTQYNKTQFYQTYDVTPYIQSGTNALGAMLAEGWWSGGATYMGEYWNPFGDRQSLLAKLVITYPDGNEEIIVSNPSTWQYFNKGPIVYGSFFQGEVYDATKETLIEGWSTASFDASEWKLAKEIPLYGHISVTVDDYKNLSLIGQFGNSVKQVKELAAQSVEEVRPGVFVYDMGQNMVGVPNIHLSGMVKGKKIVLRFAEVKYPDLPEYKENVGMIMLENIRAAMAQDIYFTKGGNETIHPRFTFHGYRFVEITGIEKALSLEAVKGTVISSIHQLASHYETSNPKVNKLWENITWSTLGNFLSIPTDCPQRNERLGWSGDISVFSRTATYLAHVPQFLRRHLRAMRDIQREDGRFTDIAPLGVGFGGILWGSAAICVAWESYQQYGDIHMVAEHYDAMKRYINFILQKNMDPQTHILTQENPTFWGNLGDWLGPEQEKNDNSLLWEAYFLFDLHIMKEFASVLGKAEDATLFETLYLERKKIFNETYIAKHTKKTMHSGFKQNKRTNWKPGDLMDTQTSYVLPLAFNIIEPENKEKAVENFVATISRENKTDDGKTYPAYSLLTGFIGTAWVNKVLSDNGRSDVAYRLLQQTTYPSWLYPVEQGATTIWERLNSYTHTNGFGGNNRMNSFNHYSFGAVGAWMYNYSLGIERDEKCPGFKHFLLHPQPDPTRQMTWAKGYYESMYGRVESSWERKKGSFSYHFVVPPNTSATLYLNASSVNSIVENGKPFHLSKGVKYIGMEKEKHVFELPSGAYHIQIKSLGK